MKPELVKEKVHTVVFMALVTFVAITLISIVDIMTKSAVERNKTLFLKKSVGAAFGLEAPATAEDLLEWYKTHVTEVMTNNGDYDHFLVKNDKGESSLVLVQRGPGLWGTITALIGFNPDASAIQGLTFQDQLETPGLGARIDEPWFRHQFAGKSGPFKKLRQEPKDKSMVNAENDEFDQITGATITSTAVKDIVNKSIERAKILAAER